MPYFTITDFAAGLDLRRSPLTAPPGTLRKLVNCHVTPGGEIEKRYTFTLVGQVDPASRGIVEVGGQLYVFKLDTTGTTLVEGIPTSTWYPSTTPPPNTPPPVTTPAGWGIGTINLQAMSAGDSPITEVFDYDTYGGSVFAITYHAGSPAPENVRRFYQNRYLKQVDSVEAETEFNPATISNVVLSNKNLTMKQTLATGDNGARGPAQNGGKYYFEIKVDVASGSLSSMGLLSASGNYANFSAGTNCVAVRKATGNIWSNSADTTKSLGAFANGDVLGVAVDLDARFVWVRKNAGNWNNDAAANPAATPATGGIVVQPTGAHAASAVCAGTGGAINDGFTVNFGATAYAHAAPTGFAKWPSEQPFVYSLTNGIHGHYCRTYKDKMFVVEGSSLGASCVGKPDAWENIPETEPPTGVKTAGYFSNDLSLQDSDMTTNIAIEVYYDKLAVMGRNATQLWRVDPNPAQMQYDSTLRGTGTIAWRSVLQYGSGDVLFLAGDGVRSLRARDSSLAASVSDVGSPIDPLIQSLHQEWGEYSMSQAISIVQPITGRVWVIMPLARDAATGVTQSRIFVLSAFPGPKISAWSEYRPPFNAVAACTHQNRIVLRDDKHNIWVYGRMEDTTDPAKLYDACPVEVIFPFHAGTDPATKKTYAGIDASCEGDWEVYASYEPSTNTPDGDAEDYLGMLTGASYEQGRWAMQGYSTHLSLRLRSGLVGDKPGTTYTAGTLGRKSLSNLTIHYKKADSD
jgi:hypothetical protein